MGSLSKSFWKVPKKRGDDFFGYNIPIDSSIRMGGKMAYKESHYFHLERIQRSFLRGREPWFVSQLPEVTQGVNDRIATKSQILKHYVLLIVLTMIISWVYAYLKCHHLYTLNETYYRLFLLQNSCLKKTHYIHHYTILC